jgi:mannose-6-phosphate isomerase
MQTLPPIPVVFDPILRPRPWGGTRLSALLGKQLPLNTAIGESWEIASLPDADSQVRGGGLAGTTLSKLVRIWGRALLGDVTPSTGRFPLLIKFLDARENLSVQVHPRPGVSTVAAIKHEAWYILAADRAAQLYVGFRDGVSAAEVATCAGTRQMVSLLRAWPARVGQCFYLPSGTPHALGGGIVAAEVQTPSDTTYRLYDWERRLPDGQPRDLHVQDALRHVRYDVTPAEIAPSPTQVAWGSRTATRVAGCPSFAIDRVCMERGEEIPWPHSTMRIWMVLRGRGTLRSAAAAQPFAGGDTVLIPASAGPMTVTPDEDCELLEVSVPT